MGVIPTKGMVIFMNPTPDFRPDQISPESSLEKSAEDMNGSTFGSADPSVDALSANSGSGGSPIPVKQSRHRIQVAFNLLGAVGYPLLLIVCQFAAAFVFPFILMLVGIFQGVEVNNLYEYISEQFDRCTNDIMVLADLLIIGILLLWFGCRKKGIFSSLGMRKVKGWLIPMGIAAGVGLNFALNYLMQIAYAFFPKVMEKYDEQMAGYEIGSMLSYVMAGVVLAPLVEELLFRALSLTRLDRVAPRGVSIIVIAGLFGLAHGNVVQGLYAGSLGVILCCLYFAYDSVWVPMSVHFGFNLLSVIALVDTSGFTDAQLVIYSCLIALGSFLFIFGGLVALVFLFILRTHPIWFKKRGAYAVCSHLKPLVRPMVSVHTTSAESVVPVRSETAEESNQWTDFTTRQMGGEYPDISVTGTFVAHSPATESPAVSETDVNAPDNNQARDHEPGQGI